jgi:transcription initiation factor TFIIIB Brf1 subunit/transcription initiation factor TFIIB
MNKVGFPWTYSASTTTTTINENFRVFLLCHEIWWVEIGFSLSSREIFSQMEVMKTMRRITSVLRVPTEKVRDVKFMLESVLENEWGQGRWIEILVGACIYIAIRQSQLPLTLLEVAV